MAAGWEPAEPPTSVAAAVTTRPRAELRAGPGGVRLVTTLPLNGGVLFDDPLGMPRVPEGWWDAVDAQGGQCAVVVVDQHEMTAGDEPDIDRLDAAARRGAVVTTRAAVIRAYP